MTRSQKSFFWLASTAIFIFLLSVLGSVLVPFVAGMAIAYFLDPVCDWLEAHGFSRTIATTIVTLVFTIVLLVFIAVITPFIIAEIQHFLKLIPTYISAIYTKAAPIWAFLQDMLGIENVGDLSKKTLGASDSILKASGSILQRFVSGVNIVADLVTFILLTPLVAFYFLRDWDRIVAKIDSWLPRKQHDLIRQQFRDIDLILSGFARGQSLVCLVLACFYGIGLAVAGLDFGLIVGFFTGLVSFVPYFGMLLGFALGIGIALAQFDSFLMVGLIALIFGAGQILEGYILTPRLIGNRVGLHPVWIIFALMAGGALFG
ncbi:MAG: AI-2E family transporter, partial [Alphaproteobacteria bacterium]|nr:AI-2E family transporter [Alphaproteobacteria bacterium]